MCINSNFLPIYDFIYLTYFVHVSKHIIKNERKYVSRPYEIKQWGRSLQMKLLLTHLRPNKLPHTIYWKSLIQF